MCYNSRMLYKLNKKYLFLIAWIASLNGIGTIIGSLTSVDIKTWYIHLNRSMLTPPNYVFPLAWTVFYSTLGVCGWLIWSKEYFARLSMIKSLYIFHMLLNWSWTPLFFSYHFTGIALLVLILMDFSIGALICLTYYNIKLASLLIMPYLCWLLFASYLNFFMFLKN